MKHLRERQRVQVATDGLSILQDLQHRYGMRLPDDFADYVVIALPRDEWMDDHGMTWWGASRIKSLREEWAEGSPGGLRNVEIEDEADAYLVFADYLMWCYAYAICCSEGPNRGRVALIGVEGDGFVANSFSSFVALASQDSLLLHSPAGDDRRMPT